MNVLTKQQLKDEINKLLKEKQELQDELSRAEDDYAMVCHDRDIAEQKLEQYENERYGDRGSN